jgi:hypothetical protein
MYGILVGADQSGQQIGEHQMLLNEEEFVDSAER